MLSAKVGLLLCSTKGVEVETRKSEQRTPFLVFTSKIEEIKWPQWEKTFIVSHDYICRSIVCF